MSQPRVRRNDWSTLTVLPLGEWTPSKSVSVVIPTYGADRTLPFVLAGLAAQTYPSHLLEVIVADDNPDPIAELPEVRPDNTRIVRTVTGNWGRAAACHSGALAADGEIVHWLDADMLVEADQVEAQLRWHHEIDYAVVLGHKWFVDPALLGDATAQEVRDKVAAGRLIDYFGDGPHEGHGWIEDLYARTDDLRASGPRAHRAHAGATASLPRALYLDAGGMATDLKLGEDSELGYRLGEAGAVFIPDREARSWHLGPSHVMRGEDDVNDYNFSYLADRIPDGRVKRAASGRSYAVPYVEVLLDIDGQSQQEVLATVDSVLASTVPDILVTLVGPWDELPDVRRNVLKDPDRDARGVRAAYVSDPRVRLVAAPPEGRSPAMVRLELPSASWAPGVKTINRLVRELEWTHHGLRTALLPDGSKARLVRTAARSRALLVADPDEPLDNVVEEIFGAWWVDGPEMGFVPASSVKIPRLPGRAGPARDPGDLPESEGGGGEAPSARRDPPVTPGKPAAGQPEAIEPTPSLTDAARAGLTRTRSLAGRVARRLRRG